MPRNRKHPTKRELKEFNSAMRGKSPAEREKLLRGNSGLKDTMRRVSMLTSTGRNRGTSCTPPSVLTERILKGNFPKPK